MPVLSDRSIKQTIEEGYLRIEPFDESRLGPISYDLTLEKLYVRNNVPYPHSSSFPYEPVDMPFDEFLSKYCTPLDEFVLYPGKNYFGMSKEAIAKDSMGFVDITTRSSLARCGVEVSTDNQEFRTNNGKVPFIVKTVNTSVRIPNNYPIAQLIIYFGLPLDEKRLTDTLSREEVHVSGNPEIVWENQTMPWDRISYMPTPDSLLLHLGPMIKRYKEGIIDITQDPSEYFEDVRISNGYYVIQGGFYIAHTQEEISLGPRYAARLVRFFHSLGDSVHMNAPWIQPGSSGNQTLEMSFGTGTYIKAGMPICRMEVYDVDQYPEKTYNGRYLNQNGPITSKSHIDFR